MGISSPGKVARRPLGAGIRLQPELSRTELTCRTQSLERSMSLPEKMRTQETASTQAHLSKR